MTDQNTQATEPDIIGEEVIEEQLEDSSTPAPEPKSEYRQELERLEAEKGSKKEARKAFFTQNEQPQPEIPAEPVAPQPTPDELVQEVSQNLSRQLAEHTLESYLQTIEDGDKRDLVRFNYQNRIKLSGYTPQAIESDFNDALNLADSHLIKKERDEQQATMRSRQTLGSASLGSSQDRSTPKVNPRSVLPQDVIDQVKLVYPDKKDQDRVLQKTADNIVG